MRILIADDEPEMVEILARYLEPMSSFIDSSPTLKGALEKVEHGNFNVVILDLRFPDSGKKEAFASIRKIKDRRAAVIVVTGIPEEGIKDEALAAGADCFVPKDGKFGERAMLIAANIATLKLPLDTFKSESYFRHVDQLKNTVKMFDAA